MLLFLYIYGIYLLCWFHVLQCISYSVDVLVWWCLLDCAFALPVWSVSSSLWYIWPSSPLVFCWGRTLSPWPCYSSRQCWAFSTLLGIPSLCPPIRDSSTANILPSCTSLIFLLSTVVGLGVPLRRLLKGFLHQIN